VRGFDTPGVNDLPVRKTAATLSQLVSTENQFCRFLRGYFLDDSLIRVAMNLVLLRRLLRPGDYYLDVGSLGVEPSMLRHEFPSCVIKAVSYEGNRIGVNQDSFFEDPNGENPQSILVEQLNIENQRFPYPDNTFDVISCFETLEHLKSSPVPMLKEIKRIIKPEGVLILTTPNLNSARSVARILCGRSPQECAYIARSAEQGVIHPMEYTMHQVHNLFTALGFQIFRLTTLNMRTIDVTERLFSFILMLTIPLFRLLSNRPSFKSGLGEKIFVAAGKGGPILSEFPESLFR
jgi:SAM-dependent methyltransferase